jgi:RND family efflux transporter MFP subunit
MLKFKSGLHLILFAALGAAMPLPSARAAEATAINGITLPFMDVMLGSSVPGIISVENFKEGDRVEKGDVILELDKKLEEFEVQRRKAVMDQNEIQMKSTQQLSVKTKSVSLEEMHKAEAEYKVSRAEYDIAVQELAHRQVAAPFSGNITEISLHIGAACGPYQPLVRLVDTTRCYFEGHIDGKDAASLHLDQPVKIEVDGADAPVIGKICFISPVVDPASGLARVKAIFQNDDGKIRPGLAAKLKPE